MSKLQTGLRIDRILFKRFQEVCLAEKLRPGEAVESLVRLAIEMGGVTRLSTTGMNRDSSGVAVDEALFRSRLARLKSTLNYERDYLARTGEADNEPESDDLIEKLVELGRRTISKELVKEFEALLTESDKLHQEIRKNMIEESQRSLAYLHPGPRVSEDS